MLISVAVTACTNMGTALGYNKPVITAGGPLVIRGGRHPILSCNNNTNDNHKRSNNTHSDKPPSNGAGGASTSFHANDTYMDSMNNMHIITGCNGAGKSIYIKQVALIVLMAQMGCYVPALPGTVIPIRDRILTRLGTTDDLEHNLSNFMLEMKECTYICNQLTDKSLVLLDEVGKGTSTTDGISIAFSIAEYLLSHTSCYTLFVTHYTQLTSLAQLYCNVHNMHLRTVLNTISTSISAHDTPTTTTASPLAYTYTIQEGVCETQSGYGIIMAEVCGFPDTIIQDANNISAITKQLFPSYLQ